MYIITDVTLIESKNNLKGDELVDAQPPNYCPVFNL